MTDTIEARPITAADALPLRLAVLRPGRPVEAAQYDGDDAPTTRHFGAFRNGKLLGIATLLRVEMPEQLGESALQLRGMATAPEVRGQGFGRALVRECLAFARPTSNAFQLVRWLARARCLTPMPGGLTSLDVGWLSDGPWRYYVTPRSTSRRHRPAFTGYRTSRSAGLGLPPARVWRLWYLNVTVAIQRWLVVGRAWRAGGRHGGKVSASQRFYDASLARVLLESMCFANYHDAIR